MPTTRSLAASDAFAGSVRPRAGRAAPAWRSRDRWRRRRHRPAGSRGQLDRQGRTERVAGADGRDAVTTASGHRWRRPGRPAGSSSRWPCAPSVSTSTGRGPMRARSSAAWANGSPGASARSSVETTTASAAPSADHVASSTSSSGSGSDGRARHRGGAATPGSGTTVRLGRSTASISGAEHAGRQLVGDRRARSAAHGRPARERRLDQRRPPLEAEDAPAVRAPHARTSSSTPRGALARSPMAASWRRPSTRLGLVAGHGQEGRPQPLGDGCAAGVDDRAAGRGRPVGEAIDGQSRRR